MELKHQKTDVPNTGGWQVWINASGKVNIRRFYPTNSDIRESTAAVPTSQWVHVVAVMLADKTAKFYINGVSSAPVTTQTGSINPNTDDVGDLWIGGRDDGTPYPFNGQLDEVAIYNRELTAAEALLHYQAGVNI